MWVSQSDLRAGTVLRPGGQGEWALLRGLAEAFLISLHSERVRTELQGNRTISLTAWSAFRLL